MCWEFGPPWHPRPPPTPPIFYTLAPQYSKPSYACAITSPFYLDRSLDLKENLAGLPGTVEGGWGGGGGGGGGRGGGSSFGADKQENCPDVSGLY